MDNFVDERDFKLLEEDKYTFFVLRRIMGGEIVLDDGGQKRIMHKIAK